MSPGSICSDQRGQFGGGSVMIWAGISLHTKTPMVPIHQNLNTARYQNLVLQPAAIPHIRANRGMVLMQDNATPHTARTTQQMIQGHKIRLLDWPPCSPGVNPIEHVWDEIKGKSDSFHNHKIWNLRETLSTLGITFRKGFYVITLIPWEADVLPLFARMWDTRGISAVMFTFKGTYTFHDYVTKPLNKFWLNFKKCLFTLYSLHLKLVTVEMIKTKNSTPQKLAWGVWYFD